MRKFLISILFISFCGGSSETVTIEDSTTSTTTETTLAQTSTTSPKKDCVVDNEVKLKVWVSDDSINKPYTDITFWDSGFREIIKPNLTYGNDSFKLRCTEIGVDGAVLLFSYDNPNIGFPPVDDWIKICFSPTENDKGDLATIWVILNDDIIEIDGFSVKDITIDRKTRTITELEDSSYPKGNC